MLKNTRRIISIMVILASVCIFSVTGFAATTPAKVSGVKATASETTCTIKWNKVSNCDGYHLYLLDVPKKKTYKKTISSQSKTTYKLTNLKPLHNYKVQVEAYKGNTAGQRSSIVAFKTILFRPSEIKIKLKSEQQENTCFYWSKSKYADYYELWRRIHGKETKAVLVNKKDKLQSCTMKHLKNGVTYTFYVRGVREYNGKKYYGKFNKVTLTPYSIANDKKLAKTVNTTSAYSGGSNPNIRYTKLQVEAYVNTTSSGGRYRSANNYLVWCNTHNYRLYIFTNKNRLGGRWTLLYDIPCIIGRSSNSTPRGIYKINGRDAKHDYGSNYAEYLSYFTGYGMNAIHSLLYPTQTDSLSTGYMASLGCVRVVRKYAKFIYTYCQGSTLIVR